jgi:hypothetical protein
VQDGEQILAQLGVGEELGVSVGHSVPEEREYDIVGQDVVGQEGGCWPRLDTPAVVAAVVSASVVEEASKQLEQSDPACALEGGIGL